MLAEAHMNPFVYCLKHVIRLFIVNNYDKLKSNYERGWVLILVADVRLFY